MTVMENDPAYQRAIDLMVSFSKRTGLDDDGPSTRYLWTDAFALMNLLCLAQETGKDIWYDRARSVIDKVHNELARHHPEDPRTGRLNGLSGEEGRLHPTSGGLRIGKPVPERGPDSPYDERLEWDRDGQYFHYLTKWMDALCRASRVLQEPDYARHARELAQTVCKRFLRRNRNDHPVGIYWKMDAELSRPLVNATNPHDALDGYVTVRLLALTLGEELSDTRFRDVLETFYHLSEGHAWVTEDPLGLGSLLFDALRLTHMPDKTSADVDLAGEIVRGAAHGFEAFQMSPILQARADQRLGFRELGLAIGLKSVEAIEAALDEPEKETAEALQKLRAAKPLSDDIVGFWSEPDHRNVLAWQEHRDINEVMLATALLDAHLKTQPTPDGKP